VGMMLMTRIDPKRKEELIERAKFELHEAITIRIILGIITLFLFIMCMCGILIHEQRDTLLAMFARIYCCITIYVGWFFFRVEGLFVDYYREQLYFRFLGEECPRDHPLLSELVIENFWLNPLADLYNRRTKCKNVD